MEYRLTLGPSGFTTLWVVAPITPLVSRAIMSPVSTISFPGSVSTGIQVPS